MRSKVIFSLAESPRHSILKQHKKPSPRPATEQRSAPGKQADAPVVADALSNWEARNRAVVQPRLKLGAVDSPHEREADAIAATVVQRMDSPAVTQKAAPSVQRKVSAAPEEEEVQRKALEDLPEIPSLQTAGEGAGLELGAEESAQITALSGQGEPLAPEVRGKMETGMGRDFSGVRVHTGAEAAGLAAAMGARAFTQGQDVFFGEGEYDVEGREGLELLAHELVHTVQQGEGWVRRKIGKNNKSKRREIDAAQKRAGIDKKVYTDNRRIWFSGLLRYLDVFENHPEQGHAVTAVTMPYTYAARVYRIQEIFRQETIHGWTAAPTGKLDVATFNALEAITKDAQQNPKIDEMLRGHWPVLHLAVKQLQSVLHNPSQDIRSIYKLTFADFENDPILALVNTSHAFMVKRGDRGLHVSAIQSALELLEYPLGKDGADGKYGAETEKAVRNFQVEHNVKYPAKRGAVDHKTLRKLDQLAQPIFHARHGRYDIEVPVYRKMGKFEFEIHVYSYIFEVTDDVARRFLLMAKFPTDIRMLVSRKNGVVATPTSEKAIHDKVGQRIKVEMPPGYYRMVRSFIENVVRPSRKNAALAPLKDIYQDAELYELDREMRISAEKIRQEEISLVTMGHLLADERVKLSGLREKRKRLIRKKGIDVSQFDRKLDEFRKAFVPFAIETGHKMLDENAAAARKQEGRLHSPKSLRKIKATIKSLHKGWSKADALFEQGTSQELFGNPDTIKESKDFLRKVPTPARLLMLVGEIPVSKIFGRPDPKKKPTNKYFAKAFALEKKVHEKLQKAARVHPILAFPPLELRANAGSLITKTPAELGNRLREETQGILENIQSIRRKLTPQAIWELSPVIERARLELGIPQGSAFHLYLMDETIKARKAADQGGILGAVGLILGVAALLASGPAAWALGVSGFALGATSAVQIFQEISFKRTAADTAMDPSKALGSDRPGWGAFIAEVFFLAIEVFGAAKLLRSFSKIGDVANDWKDAVKGLYKTKQISKAQYKQSMKALSGKMAVQRIDVIRFVEDPDAALGLAARLRSDDLLDAFNFLKHNMSEYDFRGVVNHLATFGKQNIGDLPELTRIMRKEGLNKVDGLSNEIVRSEELQDLLLDFPKHAPVVKKQFQAWKAENTANIAAGGKGSRFADRIWSKPIKEGRGYDVSLADGFGADFAKYPQRARNSRVLASSGETLLRDAINAGTLPRKFRRPLAKLMKQDLIGGARSTMRAQNKVWGQIEETIVKNMDSLDDYYLLTKMGVPQSAELQKQLRKSISQDRLAEYRSTVLPEVKSRMWGIDFEGPNMLKTFDEVLWESHRLELGDSAFDAILAVKARPGGREMSVLDISKRQQDGWIYNHGAERLVPGHKRLATADSQLLIKKPQSRFAADIQHTIADVVSSAGTSKPVGRFFSDPETGLEVLNSLQQGRRDALQALGVKGEFPANFDPRTVEWGMAQDRLRPGEYFLVRGSDPRPGAAGEIHWGRYGDDIHIHAHTHPRTLPDGKLVTVSPVSGSMKVEDLLKSQANRDAFLPSASDFNAVFLDGVSRHRVKTPFGMNAKGELVNSKSASSVNLVEIEFARPRPYQLEGFEGSVSLKADAWIIVGGKTRQQIELTSFVSDMHVQRLPGMKAIDDATAKKLLGYQKTAASRGPRETGPRLSPSQETLPPAPQIQHGQQIRLKWNKRGAKRGQYQGKVDLGDGQVMHMVLLENGVKHFIPDRIFRLRNLDNAIVLREAIRKELMASRPAYAARQVDDVWNTAVKNSPDGIVRDPNNPAITLTWDRSKSRQFQWHMGHVHGHEYRRLVEEYANGKISYSEFLSKYRDPKYYKPEQWRENIRGVHEKK